LLTLTGFTTAIPGASVVFTMPAPGTAVVNVTCTTAFSSMAGPITLGDFTASVPGDAPYGAKEILHISGLTVFDAAAVPHTLPAVGEDAIHVAAYFGDTAGVQAYSAADVILEQRIIGLINTGFPAYQLADPTLIGDIVGNGVIAANDVTSLQREVGQLSVPNIPALPTGLTPPPSGGPDPTLFVPDVQGNPGQTVSVPVRLTVTEPAGITVSGFQVAISYDPTLFTVGNTAQLGSMFSSALGFSGLLTFPAPGELIFQAESPTGTGTIASGTTTDLFDLSFTVASGAAGGTSVVNLLQNIKTTVTAVFDDNLDKLTLSPAPTNNPTDPVDGTFTIGPAATPAINVSASTLPLGTTTYGTAGAAQSFTVGGSDLTSDIVLTAPAGVELSDGGAYGTSLDLKETGGTVGTTTVMARITSTATAGTVGGKITADSSGATEQDVSVSGSVQSASQAINFTPPTSPITYSPNAKLILAATGGDSGNPVVFSVDASSAGTGNITDNTLTITRAGSIVIDANQAGNADYTAAPQVQQTVVVSKASQMIMFTAPTSPITFVPDETVSLSASAPGGAVAFSIDPSSTGTGTINGNVLTVTGVGTFVLDANQPGNNNYLAASQVQQVLTVSNGAEAPPVLPPINGNDTITLPYYQFPFGPLALGATTFSSSFPPIYSVTGVTGDSPLFDLQQQYQFTSVGLDSTTVNGLTTTAFVLHSNFSGGAGFMGYYLIRPSDGALFPYDGSGSFAQSFTGTPIATLGPDVFTDPTLLLNAHPPANYSALQALQQQFQFTIVGPAATTVAGVTTPGFLLHSTFSGGTGFMGYFVIRSTDGAIFPYDGSGSFASTFNGTPLTTTPFGASLFNFPQELINAVAAPSPYSQLYQVDQKLDLQEINGNGGFFTNLMGNQAKWLFSPVLNQYGEHYYTLTLVSGQSVLRAWQRYQDSAVGAVVATFPTSDVYNNPSLLINATYLPNPLASTVSIDSTGHLTVNLPNAGFVGTFKFTVNVTDTILSAPPQTVTVTSTDTSPVLTVTQNAATVTDGSTLNVAHGSFPLSDTVAVSAAGSKPTTTKASVSSFSQLFNLQQQLRLTFVANITAGTAADVFSAAGLNKFGNPYYLLSPAGVLFAYDGGNNYATSFAGTPVATLNSNVYLDTTLLTNAQPPVNYTQLNALQSQFQFTVAGPATAGATPVLALQSSQPGPGVLGFYLLTPNGTIYAYDGSSLATTISNSANIVATVGPGVFVNPSLLINATASPGMYPLLQQDEQQFDLQELPDGFHVGLMGNAAKWLFSPIPNSKGQHYYTLVLSADGTQAQLYEWDGGSNSVPTGASPVAVLDSSVYFDPTELLNAKAPEAATGETVNGGTSGVPVNGSLDLSAPAAFVGTFQVTVTTTDGALTTTETFQINSTDTAPVPTTVPTQTVSASASPLVVSLSSADAESDPVKYTATVASAPFALQQQYQFTGVGLFTTNVAGVTTTAYVLRSAVPGGMGGYYLLSSSGGVYAYDGSGDYSTTFGDTHNLVAMLSPAVFATPTLLTQATPTPTGAMVSVTGSSLSLQVTGVPPGTLLEVFVTAFDGAETSRTSFLVNVTV
jgi:hypothetical protein